MLIIELLEVIRTGSFGPIIIGDSKEKLLETIGTPEDSTVLEIENIEHAERLSYDWFEFTFYNGKLFRYQNKHILDASFKFNQGLITKPGNFLFKTWFIDFEVDIKRKLFEERLISSGITFTEEPFYDCLHLLIDFNDKVEIEIQFHSELAFHKDPQEWKLLDEEILDWKFGAIYVTKKTNSNIA